MKRLLLILTFFITLVHSQESASQITVNEQTHRIESVTTRDTTMEQATEMIRKAMKDLTKYDRRKIKSTIIIQGDNRSYSEPFYNLIRETIISEMGKLEDIKINFTAQLPRVIIKGTPKNLSIARTNEKDIEKIAVKSDANTIFLWNLFEFNGEMNFIARIINTDTKAIMWHYKVNKEFIQNDKLVQAELIKYQIPQNYYIAVGVTTFFGFSPYTRTGTTAANTLTSNWILGYDILYSTQSSVSPQLRLGAGSTYISSASPSLPFAIWNIYVDIRYQLNEFIAPLYDTSTGAILQRRNNQTFMAGLSFGRAATYADKENAGGTASLYLNLGISKAFEFNVGVTSYIDGALTYNTSTNFTHTTVPLGLFNMFFNVKYKYNVEETK